MTMHGEWARPYIMIWKEVVMVYFFWIDSAEIQKQENQVSNQVFPNKSLEC